MVSRAFQGFFWMSPRFNQSSLPTSCWNILLTRTVKFAHAVPSVNILELLEPPPFLVWPPLKPSSFFFGGGFPSSKLPKLWGLAWRIAKLKLVFGWHMLPTPTMVWLLLLLPPLLQQQLQLLRITNYNYYYNYNSCCYYWRGSSTTTHHPKGGGHGPFPCGVEP